MQDGQLTEILRDWGAGDRQALNQLMPEVYTELGRMAYRQLQRHGAGGCSLQPGTLVHEAYLRLNQGKPANCCNRGHFFALAARIMRFIIVDHFRSCGAGNRAREVVTLSLPELAVGAPANLEASALDVDAAIRDLETAAPEWGAVLELRFFGGLSIEETAEALGKSPATVKRHWDLAKIWLRNRLQPV